jgi:hypothetical protein
VRLTGLLQSKLIKDMDDARARHRLDPDSEEGMIADAAEAKRLDPDRHLHKLRVERIVERVAKKASGHDEDRLDRLVIEAGERLDDDDIYGDVLTKPIGELVALICRDLGLEPDWPNLSQEAWAKEEIESGVAGSPFLPPPPKVAGGGPLAEERGVEGAGGFRPPFDSAHEPRFAWSG